MTNTQLTDFGGGNLRTSRQRILNAVLFVLVTFGLFAYVPSIVLCIQVNAWGVAAADTVVYGWAIWLYLTRRRSLRATSLQVVILFYLLALFLLIALGPLGAGPYWLFAAALLSAVLFGTKAALAALLFNAVVVMTYGVAVFKGVDIPGAGAIPPTLWVVLAANLLFLNGVLALSVAAILEGLESSLKAKHRAQEELQREQERLVVTNERLNREMRVRAQLEDQLRQSQKLRAMGTLAAGIAHDFNNLLVPITTYSQLIRQELSDDHAYAEDLDAILTAADRARDLVRQILVFAQGSPSDRYPMQVQQALEEVVRNLKATAPPSIHIETHIDDTPHWIRASPMELNQLLTNLGSNAIQAMPQGGTLSVTMRPVLSNDAHHIPGARCCTPRKLLHISITDTGVGISPQHLEQIFDPFFTTRQTHGGTGLGLATVHGIVQSLHGAIQAHSVQNEGTQFNIYLPTVSSQEHSDDLSQLPQGAGETILLMDDNDVQRLATKRALMQLGYEVVDVTQVDKAIAELTNRPPHLIITDLSMTNRAAIQLMQSARALDYHGPLILYTGLANTLSPEELQALQISVILLKPIDLTELSHQIRQHLPPPSQPPAERTAPPPPGVLTAPTP